MSGGAWLVVALACGGLPREERPPPAPEPGAPERPFTGSPIAAADARLDGATVRWRAWSFLSEPVNGYEVLFQFRDGDGKVLRVAVGTPFESDHASLSFAGASHTVAPGKWTDQSANAPEVPAGAAAVEVHYAAIRKGGAALWEMEPKAMWGDPFPADNPGPDLARWVDPADRAAFAGALVATPFLGEGPLAWEVTPGAPPVAVRSWDGKQEVQAKLDFPLPCAVRFEETRPDGVRIVRWSAFTRTDAGLVLDGRDHGFTDGTDAIVCRQASAAIVLVGGTCTTYARKSGSWFPEPATCAFSGEGDERELRVDGEGSWRVEGRALVRERSEPVERPADFAAAKARVPAPR